jgi:hypothetical protein
MELARTIRQLISSFENSWFYRVIIKDDFVILAVKYNLRENESFFYIGVKINDSGCAIGTFNTSVRDVLYFGKSSLDYFIKAESDVGMPIAPKLDTSVVPKKKWITTPEIVLETFEEAIFILRAAKELEKQGLYFVGKWTPRVMSRVWIEVSKGVVGTVDKQKLKALIQERFVEYALEFIKKRVNDARSLADIIETVPDQKTLDEKKQAFTKVWMKKRKLPSYDEVAAYLEQ